MNRLDNQAVDVQGLAANKERVSNCVKSLHYDGDNWVGTYDPVAKVVLGGFSIDGETFDNDFKITEVDEENAQNALKYCAGLSVEYGTIISPYNELKKTYEEACQRDAEQYSIEDCFFDEIRQ